MFVHLNKKISIPNCSQVRCIAWSCDYEFIACGGVSGMLKVIRLDTNSSSSSNKNHLSINQTLDSHKATVEKVCWNEKYQKLTSSDGNGTIIVWMFYKGVWYEEMVNNRQRSLVTGMSWTVDGSKICIVYEDGAIITGSVDGSRLWGKELKNVSLTQVEWSPDGKIILIGTNDLDIHMFDQTGNFIDKISLKNKRTTETTTTIVAIKWFKHYYNENNENDSYRLIIGLDNGQVKMMKNAFDDNDDDTKMIDCQMIITSIEWNCNGDMFAITGHHHQTNNKNNYVKIFNNRGDEMAAVRVPGNKIYDCSWNRSGRRLVLAVDSFMYFATVKSRMTWCSLSNSIAFIRNTNEQNKKCREIIFWEMKSNKQSRRLINEFVALVSSHQYCALIEQNTMFLMISLYDSIGTLIKHHHVANFQQQMIICCMNSSRIILVNQHSLYLWQFQANDFTAIKGLLNIDDRIEETIQSTITDDTDKICCVCASEKYLMFGFESGAIHRYLLPNVTNCVAKITMNNDDDDVVRRRPVQMALNKNSMKLAVIDRNGKFYLYDFEANNEQNWSDGNWIDPSLLSAVNIVWDFKWANDNNDLIVLLEKNRIIVMNVNGKHFETLEPIQCDGYLCRFDKLSIQTIMLDQLIDDCDESINNNSIAVQLNIDKYVQYINCDYLNRLKDLIHKSMVTDAINYVMKMPELNKELWQILSDECLLNLDIETVYLAMIRNHDYKGLQFIKRLNQSFIKDLNLKRAEIHAYRNELNDAETIYLLDMDRADLAINLNKISGNFERARSILDKHRNIANYDREVEDVNRQLAHYYADKYQWQQAIRYFKQINDYDRLAECYMNDERLDSLINLVDKVSDERILIEMAMYLEWYGFCKDAVKSYVKANKIEMAIDACVKLSEWKMATELADQYRMNNVDTLLDRYVQHLESGDQFTEMIQVFRKANKIDKAINIIIRLIDGQTEMMLLKKLYVLIGIIYEENRQQQRQRQQSGNGLDELLLMSQNSLKQSFTNHEPWKGAEAFHYYLLTQKNLFKGKYSSAMNCALYLQDYEEFLSVQQIYTLLALTAYANKSYDICSKAFIKIESSSNNNQKQQQQQWINDKFLFDNQITINYDDDDEQIKNKQIKYEQMAVQIFQKHSPVADDDDKKMRLVACKFCGQSIAEYSVQCPYCDTKFNACVATGKSIIEQGQKNWMCKRCRHHAIEQEIIGVFNNCPLCHLKI